MDPAHRIVGLDAAAFFLLFDTRRAVAELLAECPRCGALSSQVLELAWRVKAVVCRECLTAAPFDGGVRQATRRHTID